MSERDDRASNENHTSGASTEADEVASAYIDGELPPEERLRVEADDDLLGRVLELRATRLGGLPPPEASPGVRQQQISAALEIYDLERSGPGAAVGLGARSTPERSVPREPSGAPDTDHERAGASAGGAAIAQDGRPRPRRSMLALAAGVLVVLVGVGVVYATGRDSSDDVAFDTAEEDRSDAVADDAAAGADTAADAEQEAAMESAEASGADGLDDGADVAGAAEPAGDAGADEEAADEALVEGDDEEGVPSTTSVPGGWLPLVAVDDLVAPVDADAVFDRVVAEIDLDEAASIPGAFDVSAVACGPMTSPRWGERILIVAVSGIHAIAGGVASSGTLEIHRATDGTLIAVLYDADCSQLSTTS